MFKCFCILLSATILISFLLADNLKNIRIMTEQYPPYNYMEKKELKGSSIELMAEIIKRDKSRKSINDLELMPWARSYKNVSEQKNTCLFSMTRSAEREKLFKWVGPIAPTKISLIAKKNRKIKIDNINDLHKYKIGAIRDDIGHQLLVKNAYMNPDLSADIISNINKLNLKRIDLWAYEENVAYWEIKKLGFNQEDFETVYVLLNADLYFAFNLATPDSTIHNLQKILNEIKKDGTYHKITKKYFN